jgi:hypothetical protein
MGSVRGRVASLGRREMCAENSAHIDRSWVMDHIAKPSFNFRPAG